MCDEAAELVRGRLAGLTLAELAQVKRPPAEGVFAYWRPPAPAGEEVAVASAAKWNPPPDPAYVRRDRKPKK